MHIIAEVIKDDEGNDDVIEDDILMEINSECDEDDDASSPNPNHPKVDEIIKKPNLELKANNGTNVSQALAWDGIQIIFVMHQSFTK